MNKQKQRQTPQQHDGGYKDGSGFLPESFSTAHRVIALLFKDFALDLNERSPRHNGYGGDETGARKMGVRVRRRYRKKKEAVAPIDGS